MKRRYAYLLIFAVPAVLASFVAASLIAGASAGVLWLFVFGDSPWPDAAGTILGGLFGLSFLTLLSGALAGAYIVGRRAEKDAVSRAGPAMLAASATALIVLLVVMHQRSVGNIGPKSDSVVCSDFCAARGFAGSGMPPRDAGPATCSCYDAQGKESVKVPIEEAKTTPRQSK
jgi:hypothetical protein